MALYPGPLPVFGLNLDLPAGAYELPCDPAALAITGVAAGAATGFSLACDAAALTIEAAEGLRDIEEDCLTGALVITGVAAVLAQSYVALTASPYAMVISANPAGLAYEPVGQRALACDAASLVMSGEAAILLADRQIACAAAALTLTGKPATFSGPSWDTVASVSSTWTPVAAESTTWTEA